MATKRRGAKRVRGLRLQGPEWFQYRSELAAAMHRFNASGASRQEVEDYVVSQFDRVGEMGLKLVRDRPGALNTAQALDCFVPQLLEWLSEWTSVGRIPISASLIALDRAEFRERLLRRAEHWKSEAYKTAAARTEETPEQRGLRRQAILNPLLQRAGINSDDAWAERAGATTDRNTPRSYRAGKTKKLRAASRENLAKALRISAFDLPD